MYHGNGGTSKQQHTTGGTWKTEYKAVNHLYDDFNDSTANNYQNDPVSFYMMALSK